MSAGVPGGDDAGGEAGRSAGAPDPGAASPDEGAPAGGDERGRRRCRRRRTRRRVSTARGAPAGRRGRPWLLAGGAGRTGCRRAGDGRAAGRGARGASLRVAAGRRPTPATWLLALRRAAPRGGWAGGRPGRGSAPLLPGWRIRPGRPGVAARGRGGQARHMDGAAVGLADHERLGGHVTDPAVALGRETGDEADQRQAPGCEIDGPQDRAQDRLAEPRALPLLVDDFDADGRLARCDPGAALQRGVEQHEGDEHGQLDGGVANVGEVDAVADLQTADDVVVLLDDIARVRDAVGHLEVLGQRAERSRADERHDQDVQQEVDDPAADAATEDGRRVGRRRRGVRGGRRRELVGAHRYALRDVRKERSAPRAG